MFEGHSIAPFEHNFMPFEHIIKPFKYSQPLRPQSSLHQPSPPSAASSSIECEPYLSNPSCPFVHMSILANGDDSSLDDIYYTCILLR